MQSKAMNLTDFIEENSLFTEQINENDFFNEGINIELQEKTSDMSANKVKAKNIELDKIAKLMHSGIVNKRLKKLVASIVNNNELDEYIDRYANLVGTILIDCSRIASREEFNKIAKNSLFKTYPQYVINCNCYKEKKIAYKKENDIHKSTIDSFLTNKENDKITTVKICSKFNLPVLEKEADYTLKDATNIAKKLVASKLLNKDLAKKILISSKQPLEIVRKLFGSIDIDKNNMQKINLDELKSFIIKSSDMDIGDIIQPLEAIDLTSFETTQVKAELKDDVSVQELNKVIDKEFMVKQKVGDNTNETIEAYSKLKEAKIEDITIEKQSNIDVNDVKEIEPTVEIENKQEEIQHIEAESVVSDDWFETSEIKEIDFKKSDEEVDISLNNDFII